MITLRPAKARGRFDHGWLDTHHTFSFGEYQDPEHMAFRSLRVINEDVVAAGAGFPTHPHRDMEIVTYVLSGALQHKDSSGGGGVIRPGDVQRMSAGSGITHSEFNASKTEPVHLLQIWIMPDKRGHTPGYEQKTFPLEGRRGKLVLVASPDGADDSVTIHQDARVYSTILSPGQAARHALGPGRSASVQMIRGRAKLNGGAALDAGDGAALSGEKEVSLAAETETEALVFDLV